MSWLYRLCTQLAESYTSAGLESSAGIDTGIFINSKYLLLKTNK